jgi:hypothetical protein
MSGSHDVGQGSDRRQLRAQDAGESAKSDREMRIVSLRLA